MTEHITRKVNGTDHELILNHNEVGLTNVTVIRTSCFSTVSSDAVVDTDEFLTGIELEYGGKFVRDVPDVRVTRVKQGGSRNITYETSGSSLGIHLDRDCTAEQIRTIGARYLAVAAYIETQEKGAKIAAEKEHAAKEQAAISALKTVMEKSLSMALTDGEIKEMLKAGITLKDDAK